MQYLLVVQFSVVDFEILAACEALLESGLRGSVEVDGHDIAKNQMNIFIFADDPRETF